MVSIVFGVKSYGRPTKAHKKLEKEANSPTTPIGDAYLARRRLNEAFLRKLLIHFEEHGPDIIDRVGKESPGTYLKVMALLMPKELKVEHSNPVGRLSDEALTVMIGELETRLGDKLAQLSPSPIKTIEHEPIDQFGIDRREKARAYARDYMKRKRAAAKAAKAAASPVLPEPQPE